VGQKKIGQKFLLVPLLIEFLPWGPGEILAHPVLEMGTKMVVCGIFIAKSGIFEIFWPRKWKILLHSKKNSKTKCY
jgi:hypothetical protein